MATNNAINLGRNSFSAYLSGAVNNVTGDAVEYTVVCDTADINEGSSYNTGTGAYVAPVTGIYLLGFNCGLSGIVAGMTFGAISIYVNAVGRYINYNWAMGTAAPSGLYIANGSLVLSLVAGDSVTFRVNYGGGARVVSMYPNETRCFGCQLL